jgi:Family of unknown function (DUF6328)
MWSILRIANRRMGMEDLHEESLEEEATHATDEARMILPGVQAILGFQLIAVFNQRFQELTEDRQILHLVAFLLLAAAMGLIMTPAAYHRQAERGCITRRFVDLASFLLTVSLIPLAAGIAIDAYLLVWLVLGKDVPSVIIAASVLAFLAGLWFVLPRLLSRGVQTKPLSTGAQSFSSRNHPRGERGGTAVG